MNETREFENTSLWRFIWPAVFLHALLIGVASLVPVDTGRVVVPHAVRADAPKATVEVDLQVVSNAERDVRSPPQVSSSWDDPSRSTVAHSRLSRFTFRRGNGRLTAPGGEDGAGDAEARDGSEQAAAVANVPGKGTAEGPTLSLEQLGVGLGEAHPAVTPYRRALRRPPSSRRRLQQSMASALEERDRARGLGAHGKVIQALEVAARAESTPPNGRAEFLVAVDETGRVAGIEVLNASGAFRAWKRAAQQARSALARYRVPLPEGARGLQIRLEIASRVQRPSGHDPDVAVSLFGIPLNEAEGDKPSKIEVLNPIPKLQWVEVPDPATGETHELPVVQLMIVPLLLGLDPADLGAPTRRVVSGRVVDVTVL